MRDLSRILSQISLWFSAAGLLGMTGIIGWQVFARYVLNAAPAWTEQAALFLMLWFILFAAAAGVREGFHIKISLLQDSLQGAQKTLARDDMSFDHFGVRLVNGVEWRCACRRHMAACHSNPRVSARRSLYPNRRRRRFDFVFFH